MTKLFDQGDTMNNVKYYVNKAAELRLLAGRMKNGIIRDPFGVAHDIKTLQECANLIDRLAQVEDAMYPEDEEENDK